MNRKTFPAVLLALLAWCGPGVATPLPTNNDPANQIRFDTAAEADAKRQQLTNFIWSGGLPFTTMPTVTSNLGQAVFAGDLAGINASLVSRVDRLDANVSNFDFHSNAYLLTPANTANSNRVVIVHQGHSAYPDRFDAGVGRTVNALLAQGFTVNVMQQPLFGWNTDQTAVVPGQGTLNYGTSDTGHAAMITNTGPVGGGMGFRLFLEPVIQSINYFETMPNLIDISMIGISGGGWTTHLAAAIDSRISLSIPVAGSAPLYARNADPPSVGDLEQFYSPLFNENIAPDGSGGGVATWLELYALGAFGEGRNEIMVTNLNDTCCFSGTFADSFASIVTASVDGLGQGEWSYYRDTTATTHEISANTLSQVLFPALGVVYTGGVVPSVPEPSTFALQLSGLVVLMIAVRRRWAHYRVQPTITMPTAMKAMPNH